jgi:DNA-binding transcriptional MerR regulator
MKGDIPDKLYFKIGEVSKLAEVAPHVIRYWETEFADISPKRANSNQRLYRRQDVELILKVKTLLHGQGYTIAGARRFLQSGEELIEETQTAKVSKEGEKLGKIKSELLQLYNILEKKK